MAAVKNWRNRLSSGELLVLDTMGALRTMGTSEKTIIRSLNQNSKEQLVSAVMKMERFLDGKADGDNQEASAEAQN